MFNEFITKHNLEKFRIKQLYKQFYGEAISSWEELTTWPKQLREELSKEVEFTSLIPEHEFVSKDGATIKILFKRKLDGQRIETVLMQHQDGRNTVCISCMVGCPVNCTFCATGKMGFGGNLSSTEIVEQVLHFSRSLKLKDQKVTNVVFMGMGEPMLNLINVEEAIAIFTDPEKMAMSVRRVTVSTSGYIPQFKQLVERGFRGRVAISLHAPNQEMRANLMPVSKIYPLEKLMETLDDYVELTNKRVSYEYVLIRNLNDQPEHAQQLANMLKHRLSHVNLIPYNPISERDFARSNQQQIEKFTSILKKNRINYSIRVTMGDDVNAACGQLADRENNKNVQKKINI